ncbi:helix-turn-helix domain-containing protein [Avibacterium endocarditidis]|uniref:Transcriptional regulator n=1 Tax=Avibacterium endocarditidis TaxID=380674 RepID=A0ABX4ZU40_9PAST|nr:XRE family transcriptional regulator [Avibacterium endocarditidis]POY43056.1 transcriptional regulator [Avibacterium endocarditidis]
MIGRRLKMARTARGLSMKQLAEQVKVSANMIKKYEHNESMPSSEVLLRLLDSLKVSIDFLFRPFQVDLGEVEFRKKSNTPQKLLNQITVDVTNQVERWLILKELWMDFPIKSFVWDMSLPAINSFDDIELIANKLRMHWKLGVNPIPNMIDLLETLGIIVIVSNVENIGYRFDGLQAVVSGLPIIVVSSFWTGDRQRFTLAHELGHLILQNCSLPAGMDIEKACNRFAGAFLFPKSQILQELGNLRSRIMVRELSLLKQEYGISMAAILYRAKDLGIISDSYHKYVSIYFRKQGWHKQEPKLYASEQTHLFKQLVYRAVAEDIISEAKGAELLDISVFELMNWQNENSEA